MWSSRWEWELSWETEVLGEHLPQCHFNHHKFHMTWPGLEHLGLCNEKSAINRLSFGTALSLRKLACCLAGLCVVVCILRILLRTGWKSSVTGPHFVPKLANWHISCNYTLITIKNHTTLTSNTLFMYFWHTIQVFLVLVELLLFKFAVLSYLFLYPVTNYSGGK
jgi:hypothetical protein